MPKFNFFLTALQTIYFYNFATNKIEVQIKFFLLQLDLMKTDKDSMNSVHRQMDLDYHDLKVCFLLRFFLYGFMCY